MSAGTLASAIAAALVVLGRVLLARRVRRPRGATRASPHTPTDAGAEVLEHLRRLETRTSPGLVQKMIPIFLEDMSARLADLHTAVTRRDADATHRVAHTIQGSAAAVGAASLERGSAEIVREARSGSFERCETLVAELDAAFESIRGSLTK